METKRFGIDPGQDGALVVVDMATKLVTFHDVPMFKAPGGKPEYDVAGMTALLRPLVGDARGVLEKVHAMPKQGVSSSFKFGVGWGLWRGILGALDIPHMLVNPERWKKVVLADAPDTDAGEAAVASRLYPATSAQLVTPRRRVLTGRVDALLMAHYGILTGV